MTDFSEDLATAFGRTNDWMPRPPPRPDPGGYGSPCSASRVAQVGGSISELLVHPAFVPFEVLYRKLPEAGMFTATPQRNFTFELGAFQVPQQMTFVFADYSFNVFRPNGAAVGDSVPIEEARLTTVMGYDVKISAKRPANIRMEIDPVPIESTKDAFSPQQSPGVIATNNVQQFPMGFNVPAFEPSSAPQQATPAQFNAANFARSSTPSGPGLSLLPQRRGKLGPLKMFTYARENETVSFEVVIFKPIPIPISFIEVDVTGILMPSNVLDDMINTIKPCVSQGGGR
jgi:hypothetical protein